MGFGFPFGPASLAARPAPASSPSRPRARAPARGVVAPRQRSVAACPYAVEAARHAPLWPPQRPRPLTPSARSSSSVAPSILPLARPQQQQQSSALPSPAPELRNRLAAAPAHRLRLRLRPRCALSLRIRCSPQPARIRPPSAVMARRSSGRAHRSDPLREPHTSTPLLAHFSSARAPHLHHESH
jgi:hypothetical protein